VSGGAGAGSILGVSSDRETLGYRICRLQDVADVL
jgi:hypothetical protein